VSAIVLASEAAATAALEAVRKASAGAWGEQVRARSVDPQAKANVPLDLAGDFGFVSPPGDPRGENARVPSEVRDAVFQIANVGDVFAHPVRAGTKFYVVRLTAKTEPHDRTLEEAERMIRVKLSQQKFDAKKAALLDELKQEFPVSIDANALAAIKVDLPGDGGTPR
jgi:peptidyl-prolyl cis-trans isomerase C